MAGNIIQQLKNDDYPLEVPSLLDLSARIVANNAENLLSNFGLQDPTAEQALLFHQQMRISEKRKQPQQPFYDQGLLPVPASEKVLQKLCEKWRERATNPEELYAALTPFYNGQLFPMENANFSSVQITNGMLAAFLVGQSKSLTSLNLVNTDRLKGMSAAGLCTVLQKSNMKLVNLRSLKLNSLDILRIPRMHGRHYRPPQFVHFCPNLEHLYLLQASHAYYFDAGDETKNEFLVRIFSELPKLRTLDLSGWVLQDDLSPLKAYLSIQSLTTLVLYDVPNLESSIFAIAELTTLKHLDISQSDSSRGQYAQPVSSLHKLICSLRELKSLDISGTNLTTMPSENDSPFRGTGTIDSDIPGLSYLERPLQFLGIFNCEGTDAEWKNIPAEKISGEHNEDQLLTAMQMYLERPKTICRVLNRSYQLYRDGSNLHRHVEALHLVLQALEMHLGNNFVQFEGIVSMLFVMRDVRMNQNTKRRVIQAFIDGMENHLNLNSQTMLLYCCFGLSQFDIPHDILFAYGRVANLLTKVLKKNNLNAHTQRKAVWLLFSMVRQVEIKLKIEMGETGAIEVMLQQISRKLQSGTCDDVVELGWFFLWNVVTHETRANYERFLSAQGLTLFNRCYANFAENNSELVTIMKGMLLNIAAGVYLFQDRLIANECLDTFGKLLDNLNGGIEVPHISAGILANLISDYADECWTRSGVILSRDHVSMLIVQAIEKWDLHTCLSFTFKTLNSILPLLSQWHAIGSQHWAMWTLANLTTANDENEKQKHCRLISEEDGGMELLEQLKTDSRSTDGIRQLACAVIKNVEDWKNNSRDAMMTDSADAGNN